MKTLITIIVALLVATSASAVVDTGENSLGLYFDENADVYCLDGVEPGDQFTIYIILTNPTFDYLDAWECGVTPMGDLLVLSYYLYGNAMSMSYYNSLVVYFNDPYPTSTVTLLASYQAIYLNLDLEPAGLYQHGSEGGGGYFVGVPGLLTSDGDLIPAGMSVVEGPAIQINGECTVVPTNKMSFDSVKALYR